MKKSIIAVAILLLVIAILPVIGNKFIKSTIDDRIAQLQSYGLEVKEDLSDSSYLHTSRHFEFYLQDSSKFIEYLNNYADNQIPPYVNAIMNGLTIGVDVKYSNLPFAKSQNMEIYPLSLSPEVAKSIKANNPDFSNYIDQFLQSKGILYHINYNFLNQEFDGYIKDIDESYTLQNDAKLKLIMKKVTFNGKGELLAPTRLQTEAKEMHFSVMEPSEQIKLSLQNLTTSNNFDSQNTYISNASIKNITISMIATNEKANVVMDNLQFNASSNDQNSKIELDSKSSIESMDVVSNNLSFNFKNFNMDVALRGIDKVIFEKLRTLTDQSQASAVTAELLSKGLHLDIADFSVKSLNIKQIGALGGFQLHSKVDFKEDANLQQKLQQSPMLLLSDLSMKTDLEISKTIFTLATQNNPFASQIKAYAKEKNDNYVFEINYIDSKATINGKALN